LIVSKRTSDDRVVDCLDIHFGLLIAEHAHIIAVWALLINRFFTQKVAFLPQKPATFSWYFSSSFHKYL